MLSFKKNIKRKEVEYKKLRSISKKEENFKALEKAYRVFYYMLVFLFAAVAVYVMFFSPFMAVSAVEITGLEDLDRSKVSSAAKDVYGGAYLKLIPKNNFLLFPRKAVSKKLQEEFKRIRSVEISRSFPDKVEIKITERKALLLWCSIGEECFIVDENGYAYNRVRLDSKEALENNLVKIISEEETGISEGDRIFDAEKVIFLLGAKELFREKTGLEFEGDMRIKSKIAEEVVLKSRDGWGLHVSMTLPLEKAAQTLKLFLEKEMDTQNMSKLEYIDLRVENRIYYKFKKEEEKEGEAANGEEGKDDKD
ncbi:MAG: hypothetical protein UY41_C0002G0008 [Candidatus Moranbacteria bacterium GW2011_GWE1_49_15]|nr:MAG: hypothetical protein UX75_C0003G0007 [Candidatus Moranbacteria bacterium GW2011_GWE2_47_10]KKW07491.1 MAG: hypothetical protein UY41_C0002G0008 [Candidatus Moranbacteria bacterium GW2011_GWE1_49_15]HBP01269.1 hypothetical protein [Candidatus Moranbacteria bacterium]